MSALKLSAAALRRADERTVRRPCSARVTLTRHRSADRTLGSGSALAAERVKEHPVSCAAARDGMAQSASATTATATGALPCPDRITECLPPLLPRSHWLRRTGRARGGRRAVDAGSDRPPVVSLPV